MATVNVTTANTFEQWRVKTNEIGTAIGDLSNLSVGNSGHATLVGAVNAPVSYTHLTLPTKRIV